MNSNKLFIILPGFTMNHHGMKNLIEMFKEYIPRTRSIILKPPLRNITIYKNKKYRSWFDYYTDYYDKEDCINNEHLIQSRKRIHKRIQDELKSTNINNA
jgi:hypothetical protein